MLDPLFHKFYTQNVCLSGPKNTDCKTIYIFLFVLFDSLRPSQQFFRNVGTGLPGLNQYPAGIKVSCSRTQHSASGEARACDPSI